jgi:hypothetical protein
MRGVSVTKVRLYPKRERGRASGIKKEMLKQIKSMEKKNNNAEKS